MPNQTRTGKQGEQKVATALRKQGFKTKLSEGSRGPADVLAKKGQVKVAVQVKTSRGGRPKKPTTQEVQRLQRLAAVTGAVPAVARVRLPKTRAKRQAAKPRGK